MHLIGGDAISVAELAAIVQGWIVKRELEVVK